MEGEREASEPDEAALPSHIANRNLLFGYSSKRSGTMVPCIFSVQFRPPIVSHLAGSSRLAALCLASLSHIL